MPRNTIKWIFLKMRKARKLLNSKNNKSLKIKILVEEVNIHFMWERPLKS